LIKKFDDIREKTTEEFIKMMENINDMYKKT